MCIIIYRSGRTAGLKIGINFVSVSPITYLVTFINQLMHSIITTAEVKTYVIQKSKRHKLKIPLPYTVAPRPAQRTHTHTHTHHRVSPDLLCISDPYLFSTILGDVPNIHPFLLQSRICRQTPTTHIISTIGPLYIISKKYRLSLPDDGSYVIRNMLE
jgi:hypothetical protein